MHITFGLDLDAGSYPAVLTDSEASFARQFTGPRGLLQCLETHCGLLGHHASEAVRIAVYARRLTAGDSPTRFFHRSLARDRWGTARTLLHWRDALVAAGWQPAPSPLPRLADLAAIEAVSSPPLPFGPAERLRALLRVLPSVRHPVTHITHAEPLAYLPPRYRELLLATGAILEPVPPPCAPAHCEDLAAARRGQGRGTYPGASGPGHCEHFSAAPGGVDRCVDGAASAPAGDLSALQQILLDPAAPAARPVGDGSFLRLRGADPWQTADALAAWLAAHPDDARHTVIVRSGMAQVLDQALHRHGLPALGSSPRSPWRPAAQVLALAFAIAWKPLDPHRLLEFLTLPVGPLPFRAAAVLARAFRESPGTGGEAWTHACEEAVAAACDGQTASVDAGPDDADLAAENDLMAATAPSHARRAYTPRRVRKCLDQWIGSQAVAAFSEGIPRATACAIAGRVAQWAEGRARGRGEAEPIFRAAARQAADMRAILSLWDASDAIPRPQVEQMLDQVQAAGTVAFAVPAEAQHIPCVDAPGALLADAPVVVWWNFAAPADATISRPPWSDAEIAALGLPLDDLLTATRGANWRWRMPFLRARRRLILATPDAALGRPTAGHPLEDEVRARFCPSSADERRVTRSVRSLLEVRPTSRAGKTLENAEQQAFRGAGCGFAAPGVGSEALSAALLPVASFPVRPLESPPATWTVAPGRIAPLPADSASSLESLLACPLQWILRYVLELRPGALRGFSDGARLAGTLAHDVLEELLPPGPVTMDPQEASNRAAAAFDRRLPQQATPLLLPARTVERLRLRAQVARAAAALAGALRSSGLVVHGTEEEREARVADLALRGRLDLLLEDPATQTPAIVDFKFGDARYLRTRLHQGTAVQLATYAQLARPADAASPAAGYFSVTSAQLLVQEASPIPGTPVVGPSLQMVWDRVVASRAQRLDRLRDGFVDAAGHPEAATVPLPVALDPPCALCDYGPICLRGEASHAC